MRRTSRCSSSTRDYWAWMMWAAKIPMGSRDMQADTPNSSTKITPAPSDSTSLSCSSSRPPIRVSRTCARLSGVSYFAISQGTVTTS